jgi:hypothetical protein
LRVDPFTVESAGAAAQLAGGPYEIVALLGEGGIGQVEEYFAQLQKQTLDGRDVGGPLSSASS